MDVKYIRDDIEHRQNKDDLEEKKEEDYLIK
jgi:hypothetical protein